jgi:pilus assembly protein CpaB
MSPKKLLLLGVAVAAGVGTVYTARSVLQPPPAPVAAPQQVATPEPQPKTRVLVAAKAMPAGHLIAPEDIVAKPWDEEDERLGSYFVESVQPPAELHGAVVRRGVEAGVPLIQGRIVKPGEQGFLAAVMEPGMRAVAVRINEVTGIAGLVFPGDRVDLLLTQTVQRPEDPQRAERRAAETVLTNLRVLAVDQSTNDQTATPTEAEIVTLEVTPKQAELVTLIAELGILSLSLRSLQLEEAQPLLAAAPAGPATDGGADVQLHGALGYGLVASGAAGAVQGFVGQTGSPIPDFSADASRPGPAGTPATLVDREFPNLEISAELAAALEGLTAAERAATLRSLNRKPYSWDSDVSLLLPDPADAESVTRSVQIVRGTEAAVVPFKR